MPDAGNHPSASAGERPKAGTSTRIESMMPSPGLAGPATGSSEEPQTSRLDTPLLVPY